MVNALFLLLAAAVVLVGISCWRHAWRQAKANTDPELLYWLLAVSAAAAERRAGVDRRRERRGQDRRAG